MQCVRTITSGLYIRSINHIVLFDDFTAMTDTSTLCSSLILSCCNSSRLFSHCSRSSKSIPRYSQTTFSMSFLNTCRKYTRNIMLRICVILLGAGNFEAEKSLYTGFHILRVRLLRATGYNKQISFSKMNTSHLHPITFRSKNMK